MDLGQIRIVQRNGSWHALYTPDNGEAEPRETGISAYKIRQDRAEPSKQTCTVLMFTIWQLMAAEYAARTESTSWCA